METFRRKRAHGVKASSPANVTTIVDRSSSVLIDKAHRELHPTAKQQKLHKSSVGSSPSRSSITTEEDQPSSGRSSLRPPRGTLMKNLLADELSKGSESKRRSPGVIARLMGLDMPPPQHNASKQKRLGESYQGKSSGLYKNNKLHSSSQSFRTRGKELQQFKDVYEVGESLKTEVGSFTSQGPPNRQRGDDEMTHTRRKSTVVKHLSANEQHKDSKGLDDKLENLDSNRDILVKLLDEPDSLFAKHLHELQVARQSHCGHILHVKSANALRHNIHAIGHHSVKEASRKIDISFSENHDSSLYSKSDKRLSQNSKRSSHLQEDGMADMNAMPTKIVVLKPNFAKLQDSAKSLSSCQDLLSDCKAHKDYINTHNAESVLDRKGLPHDLDNSNHKSRESRELAKEITQQMRSKLSEGSINVSLSGNRRYFAEESSHDMSRNEYSDDSEMSTLTRRTPLHARSRNKPSALQYTESHVNVEAKKRLSERWKMSNKSKEAVLFGKGSTLGEMLAIPEMDVRQGASDTSDQDGSFTRCNWNESIPVVNSPLGISSKDGWKDVCVGSLSRSKSLPISYRSVGSPGTGIANEAARSERSVVPKVSKSCRRNRATNRYFLSKEDSFIGCTGSDHMKNVPSGDVDKEIIYDFPDIQFSQSPEIISEEKDLSDFKSVILECPSDSIDTSSTINKMVDVDHGGTPDTLNHLPDRNLTPEISANVLVEDKCSGTDIGESNLEEPPKTSPVEVSAFSRCPLIQPKSAVCGKESDQPSPVSVLDALFAEELSSGSECFERVSAELHGLRMQLKLLKQEADSCDEGLMLTSSDEDGGERSTSFSCDKGSSPEEECWDSSYLVDVLTEAGFYNCDPDMFMANWHSPECPVGSGVFASLEKKYSEHKSCQRPDRKLLFDRINASIIDFSQRFKDPHPWVGSLVKGAGGHPWPKDGVEAWAVDFLTRQEERATGCKMDELLLNEVKWIELRDHIDGIGGNIEKLLIDELVTEIVKVCQEDKIADCKMENLLITVMERIELRDHIDSIGGDIEKSLIDELVAEIANL